MDQQLNPITKLIEERRPMFRHRPALAVLIAVLIGMAIANAGLVSMKGSVIAAVIVLVAFLACFFSGLRPYQNAVVLGLCIALGVCLYNFPQYEHNNTSLRQYAENAKRAKINGIITEIEELRNGHLFIIDVEHVVEDSMLLPLSGRIAATLGEPNEDAGIPLPVVGDSISLFTTLQPLRSERNPYAESYDERLKYHYGAHATAVIGSRFDYYLRPTRGLTWFQKADQLSALIRSKCHSVLRNSIEDRQTLAFVNAVVLGIRSDLGSDITLDFKRAGLTHLLAISGFNIAVVSLLIAQVLLLIGVRRRSIRLPITAFSVAGYCFIVGFEPSVFRAFLMVELYLMATMLERKTDLANLAAATALVHLFINPMVVHDAGFQLSYAAVFGFALIQPELSRLFESSTHTMRERNWFEWLRHSLILSISAFLATAPILAFHFGQISFVVLLANLLAIPVAAVITILGFVLIPLGAISPSFANPYGEVLSWLVKSLYWSSDQLSRLGGSGAEINLNIGWLILLSIFIFWIVRAVTLKKLVGKIFSGSIACFIVSFLIPATRGPVLTEGKLSMVFADVGQGDAAILKTPSGKYFMFDFGPLTGSDPDFTARAYTPLLQTEGMEQLEAGFITHLHWDHYAALTSAVDAGVISKIYTVGDRSSDKFAYSLDSTVSVNKIKVDRLHAGEVLDLDKGVRLYVLAPDSSGSVNSIHNDRSLILKLVYGRTSYLLLGDIEREGEVALLKRYGDFLRSDVVKVAHHGSISSSTRELAAAAKGKYAVISCGRNNRFGHPHPAVVSRWMRSGAEVLRTDLDGAIILESDGEMIGRVNWKAN